MDGQSERSGEESLVLEVQCNYCSGRGRFGRDQCDACDGSGYVPTELGSRILDLMRHNLRPMIQEADLVLR